jgi:multicomponent Na+:H+ antiporter subunit E
MMTRLATFAWLLFLWVALLGSASVASVLFGALLSAGLLIYFQPTHTPWQSIRFRPLHAAGFLAFFAVKFAQANIQVALAVIDPERVRRKRAVIAVPIVDASEMTTLVLANAVCLTPGTFVLEMRSEPPTLYVHVLQLSTPRELRLGILEMERRIALAVGPKGAGDHVKSLMALVSADAQDEGRHVSWKPSR